MRTPPKVLPELTESDKQRFWAKVDKAGEDECWNWTGAPDSEGYGLFGIHRRAINYASNFKAHRVAFILTHGEPPSSKPIVCHSCDNGLCCNPNHLWAGTDLDNNKDMERKGRGNQPCGDSHPSHLHPELRQGESNGNSKLTKGDVVLIREIYAAGGKTQKEIGAMFGANQGRISSITRCASWRHI